jgi:hypothetical protein
MKLEINIYGRKVMIMKKFVAKHYKLIFTILGIAALLVPPIATS